MASLHIVDYIISIMAIVLSFAVGVFFSCQRKTNTTDSYLLANRQLSIIPISISLLVSFFSAISMLGNSSEMYYYGAEYMLSVIGWNLGAVLATFTYVPLMQPLKLVSVNEYFMMRYNQKGIVYLGCFSQCLTNCFVNGVVLYGPAIMMESMIDIPVWISILVIGVVATVYTTIGGFKAVIWSDVFQAVVIFIGLLLINIVGTIKANGVYAVWNTYYEQGRFNLRLTPSPFERSTVWAFLLGPILMKCSLYGIVQAAVQRYSALPSLSAARKSVLFAVPGHMIVISLTCISGVVAFSYFTQQGCDPLRNKDILNSNQIIPYFVVEVLNYPGIPGIFIACIFCGSFSNLSSSYNGVSAMVWQDVLKDALKDKQLTEFQNSLITKVLSFIAGILSIIFAFAVTQLSGTLVQLTMSFISGVSLPLLIILCLGALTPRSSWRSAVLSGLLSGGFVIYLAVGTALSSQNKTILPTVTYNCSAVSHGGYNLTTSTMLSTSNLAVDDDSEDIFILYKISFMWYSTIGYILGVTLGIVLSFIPGFKNTEDVDLKLIFPFMRKFWQKSGYLQYNLEKNGVYVPTGKQDSFENNGNDKIKGPP